jgi:hypothetical protein
VSVLLNQTRPPLKVSAAGSQIVVAWPTNAAGFQLESTTNFLATNSWSAVGTIPTVSGTQNVLSNSMDASLRFYRLKK